jgi:hypothetical protein
LFCSGGLLLCTPFAWGQKLFGDRIQGDAFACKTVPYRQQGNTKFGYVLQDGKKTSCATDGSGVGDSAASIGPPVVAAGAKIGYAKKRHVAGGGDSSAYSYDEAILTPPSGFDGNTVKVVLETQYEFSIHGATPNKTVNYCDLDWFVEGSPIHEVALFANGSGSPHFKSPFDIPKVGSSFQFELAITAGVAATAGGSVSCNTEAIQLNLPAGWTYKWASDDVGYGHPTSSQPA